MCSSAAGGRVEDSRGAEVPMTETRAVIVAGIREGLLRSQREEIPLPAPSQLCLSLLHDELELCDPCSSFLPALMLCDVLRPQLTALASPPL